MANEFDPELPSNILIFEVRRDAALFAGFSDRMEEVMESYNLSEAERAAWRNVDLVELGSLGVHPYFLPQVTRLVHGSADNDSKSMAAQAYKTAFGDEIVEHKKRGA
jgi:hypothetical protein